MTRAAPRRHVPLLAATAALALALAPAARAQDGPPPAPPPPASAAPGDEDAAGPAPASDVVALSRLALPADSGTLALRDVDGDGRRDALLLEPAGVRLRLQHDDGRFPDVDDDLLPWPGPDVGFDVVDADGDGRHELALLVGGRRLVLHAVSAGGFDDGRVVSEDVGATLPRGVRRVRMLRDVDGDGRADVVVPAAGRYRIFVAQPDGSLAPPLEVASATEVAVETGERDTLHGRFGQSVLVPWVQLRDLDGDGRQDLVSETEDVVLFHLGRPELPAEPTYRIDLAELAAELEDGRPRVDLENVFANLDVRVTWRVADLDGVLPHDLIVQHGGTFRIWLGGAADGPLRTPDVLLKSSGNVLHWLLRDVLGDGLPELQIIRGEKVSLGQIARWLVIPGALDFDVFTYGNEQGRFGRKPARRATVRLEIPRLLAFIEELEETQETLGDRLEIPARALDLHGDGRRDDVVDVRDGALLLFSAAVPGDLEESLYEQLSDLSVDGMLEVLVLDELDELQDGAVLPVDLADVRELRLMPGYELRRATTGRTPDASVPLPPPVGLPPGTVLTVEPEIHVDDLDGDGRDDLVLVGPSLDGTRTIWLGVQR